MQILGIDISKYQKPNKFNMSELYKQEREFIMLRAGYGKYRYQKDIAFERHYSNALKNSLHIGAYHYSCALSISDAKKEADCFLQWIDGKTLDYPVAYDVEYESQKFINRELVTEIAYTFMNRVESEGYYTMLYINPTWAKHYINMPALSHFDTWLACYTSLEKRIELYKGNVGIWQYTSSLKLPTVYKSRLDGDIAYKDYAKIIKKAGLNNVH